MEIEKEATFLVVFNNPMIKITIHSRTSKRTVVFSNRITPTFLNTGATDQEIWESLASILKSSGSTFFGPTTGIQSGPNAFAKPRPLETRPYQNSYLFTNVLISL